MDEVYLCSLYFVPKALSPLEPFRDSQLAGVGLSTHSSFPNFS